MKHLIGICATVALLLSAIPAVAGAHYTPNPYSRTAHPTMDTAR